MFTTPITDTAFVATVAGYVGTLGLDHILEVMIGLGVVLGLIWRRLKPRGA